MSLRAIFFLIALYQLVACAAPPPTPTPIPPTSAPTAVPTRATNVLVVDASQPMGEASPYLLGTNYGPYMFVLPAVKTQFEESGISIFRFPGGNYGDQHDIEEYQFDQFIALARNMNAQTIVSVRLRGGTPEQAAALVKYARDKNFNVTFWSIGNEPSLYAQGTGADERWNTEFYNQQWRAFADAMKAVDPTIKFVGPDTHQFTGNSATDPKDKQGRDWLREFLKANGDLVDVVAVHRYPFPSNTSNPAPTVQELFADAPRWTNIIRNLRAVIREETNRDLPIAFAEWNSNWADVTGGEATPDSFNNALWFGDVLGQMLRERVDYSTHWRLLSPPGGFGLISSYDVYPSYYTFQIYKKFGSVIVDSASDIQGVSVYAARRQDGSLTVVVVNLNDSAQTVPLQLIGFAPSGEAVVWLFDETHQVENVGTQKISDGAKLEIPARAMLLYEIPGF